MAPGPYLCTPPFFTTDVPGLKTGTKVYLVRKGVEGIYADYNLVDDDWKCEVYENAADGELAWKEHCRRRHCGHDTPQSLPPNPFNEAAWRAWRAEIDRRQQMKKLRGCFASLSVGSPPPPVGQRSAPATALRVTPEDVLRAAAREFGGGYRASPPPQALHTDAGSYHDGGDDNPEEHPSVREGGRPRQRLPQDRNFAESASVSTTGRSHAKGVRDNASTRVGNISRNGEGPSSRQRTKSSSPRKRGNPSARVSSWSKDDLQQFVVVDSDTDEGEAWYLVVGEDAVKTLYNVDDAKRILRRSAIEGKRAEMLTFDSYGELEEYRARHHI
ncbi:hypothetical protein BD626DRAFT_575764 [Schizophyllum amplum]|uniref:Uncharacterized protein n=1 Tax=Schizophyllum amplum TaxID=97359 RepID=A0A550BV41_9AGAR|nr:hypothetical protein BD626DRAFT_575764 [Auriculariopsis ampla]